MSRDRQHKDEPRRNLEAPRRRGGQELPDEVQDRPEQNAGYDAAVHQEDTGDEPSGNTDITADPTAETPFEEIGDPAERDVISEIRRRERSNQ